MLRTMTAAVLLATVPVAANAAPPKGVWTNPKKSVRVAFRNCGRAMCGKVVWASPKAQADAQGRSSARCCSRISSRRSAGCGEAA